MNRSLNSTDKILEVAADSNGVKLQCEFQMKSRKCRKWKKNSHDIIVETLKVYLSE